MSSIRIQDLPEATPLDAMKIPTGGFGDVAVTISEIANHFKMNSGFATKEQLDTHVNNKNNPHDVTKSQIGLGNVDNTSDVNKPISTANQVALDTKADKITTYTKEQTNSLLLLKADDALVYKKSETYSKSEVDTKVGTVSGGYFKAFDTLAQLQAATGMTEGQVAKVMNDPTSTNNGDYYYNGTAWVKGYDALTDAKSYAENAVISSPNKIESYGYYTGTSETSLLSQDGPDAYAVQVNSSGYIKKFRTQLAGGGPTQARVQVYRPSQKGATLIETRVYTVEYPESEVSLVDNPIHVEKNDLVTLAWISGIYIRGKLVESGDNLGSVIVSQTLTVGQEVAIKRSRNTLEFQFDLLVDTVVPNNTVDYLTREAIGKRIPETLQTFSVGALNSPTSPGDTNYAYGYIDALSAFGKLKKLEYTTRNTTPRNALFRLCILTPNADGTHKVSDVRQVVAPVNSSGVCIATDTNFGDIFVDKGGFVLIIGTDIIDAPIVQIGIAGGFSYISKADINIGSNVTVSRNSNNQPLSIKLTYEQSNININERLLALEQNSVVVPPPLYSTQIDYQNFNGTVLPSDWNAPNWTVNNGLVTPATGSWTAKALSTGSSALANREYSFDIEFTDVTTTITGFCTDQIEFESGAGALLIDCTQNKLILYKYNGSAAGTMMVETAIDPIVVNQKYRVVIEKNGYFSHISFINKTTGVTAKLEYSDTTSTRYVQFHGRAGFLHIQGSAKFTNYSFKALYPKEVHAILIGDSNSERAANVLPNMTWAFQLAEKRRMNADVIVAGRSGDETPNFLKRKDIDLKKWLPKYVVWALGTNDTDQAVWRTNMQQNIADTLALGAIPILTTQVPRNQANGLHFLMDEDVRNGYFGNYKYIDFAKAITLNNNGYTWNPIYNSGDSVHVNPLGQSRILQQIEIDAPELIR